MDEKKKKVRNSDAGCGCLMGIVGGGTLLGGLFLMAVGVVFGEMSALLLGLLISIACAGLLIAGLHTGHYWPKSTSKAAQLPSLRKHAWLLPLILLLGGLTSEDGGVLFLPFFLLVPFVAPIMALSLAIPPAAEPDTSPDSDSDSVVARLTWKQVIILLITGMAAFLVVGMPFISVGEQVEETLTFIFYNGSRYGPIGDLLVPRAFILFVLLYPLVAAFVKWLAVSPFISQARDQRHAFLLGGMVGVGFAAVEGILYSAIGGDDWWSSGLLVILAAAIHPLQTGMMGQLWYDRRQKVQTSKQSPNKPLSWLLSKSLALLALTVALHIIWNGSLFLAKGSPRLPNLMVAVGIAGLIVVIVISWLGINLLPQRQSDSPTAPTAAAQRDPIRFRFTLSLRQAQGTAPSLPSLTQIDQDRALAIWGVLCLILILPLGLLMWQVWGW